MTDTCVTPRGFTFKAPSSVSNQPDASALMGCVDNLYEAYINRTENTDSWSYRSKVLEVARAIFGHNFGQWLFSQEMNRMLDIHARQFLEETARFVLYGRRHIGIRSHFELITEYPSRPIPVSRLDLCSTLRLEGSNSSALQTSSILQRWCSHPGGFEDMLCTLYVLFGKARNTNGATTQ